MKVRVLVMTFVLMLLSLGVMACNEEEQQTDTMIGTETEESVDDYIDVIVEEPSEDSEDVIPETDIELE